jgi:hypothetical protein
LSFLNYLQDGFACDVLNFVEDEIVVVVPMQAGLLAGADLEVAVEGHAF